MCGIVGFVGSGTKDNLKKMLDAVTHRGPDHSDFHVQDNVFLAHARLSIIDTSSGANQPMLSQDNNLALVFNGEIYNFTSLRANAEKRGYKFRTTSDTEVILALYELEGLDCFKKFAGMFAIALYNFKEQTLLLARDRMGEKPLYYSYQNGLFVFASELSSLMVSGLITKELDPLALHQYLQLDYVPSPHCIIRNVYKLEPATILTFHDQTISKEVFWQPPSEILTIGERDTVTRLDQLLNEVVTRELIADVPLGVFLSGGIDSSAITYYAQKNSSRPVETFSIAFDEASFDESEYARAVAEHLGTNHNEQLVTAQDMLNLIPSLGSILSEPMADASIIPTLLLSQFTRKSVTVALGGDGGDELFAGYPTFLAERAHPYYATLPHLIKKMARFAITTLPTSHANITLSYGLKKFISSEQTDKVRRHLEWLGTFDGDARKQLVVDAEVSNAARVFEPIETFLQDFKQYDEGNRLLFAYARSYLMDQVLVKVDRASMQYALETRAPFLDHSVVDFAFSLPYDIKYRRGQMKYLLKELMSDRLPKHIVYRKKKGFGIPLARWLAGPLRDLTEDLLSESALKTHGLFDISTIHDLIKQHLNGSRDNRKEIWNLIVFQLWYDRWMR